MARLNSDARDILCNMVTERAAEKRKILEDELASIELALHKDLDKRISNAKAKLEYLFSDVRKSVNKILKENNLDFGKSYCGTKLEFEDIVSEGKCKEKLKSYLCDATKSHRKSLVKKALEDLDAKVAKAKQEILLRAALGMKYDEVVAIANSFQF